MSTTRKFKRTIYRNLEKKGFVKRWLNNKRFNILYALSVVVICTLIIVIYLLRSA